MKSTALFLSLSLAISSIQAVEPFAKYTAGDLKDAASQSAPEGPGPTSIPDLGGVLRFEGMDYIQLPTTLRGRDKFSVSIWFRPEAVGTTMVLIGAGKGYNLSLSEEENAGGRIRWGQFTTGWQPAVISDEVPAPGAWHNVIVTSDGTTVRMYVDGVLQSQQATVSGAIEAAGDPELIGAYATSHAAKWIGAMKDIQFFDQALDEAQVKALYASQPALVSAPALKVEKISSAIDWQTPSGPDYLKLVEGYANLLVTKGRDVYGSEPSPLIAAALNRETMRIGSFPGITGIRGGDRITTGANPMTDQNLYQILYALTAITGDKKYKDSADETLKYFFSHCQSPATGLLAWGEHMGWDFKTEAPIRDTHEYFRPWVLWDESYKVDPKACLTFAQGLWDHQIFDQKKGTFSRHGEWLKHGPRYGFEFPRHGGFYIYTWAKAFQQSKDPVFLEAITSLVGMFDRNKSPQTGAIRCSTSPNNFTIMWPSSNMSLAVDLAAGSSLVPNPPRDAMLSQAAEIDKVFLTMKHAEGGPDVFFIVNAKVDTLEPFSDKEHDAYASLWAASYGHGTGAQVANLCYLRYLQLPAGEAKEAYKKLILECASRYLSSDPDLKKPIYPGAVADVLGLLLNAYEISSDKAFLSRAEHFAQLASDNFFPGGIPIPIASSKNTHYEAVTRGDSLMLELLRLWNLKQPKPADLSLVYTDR